MAGTPSWSTLTPRWPTSTNESCSRRELLDALDNEGLVLEYQPTFELATMAITGVEALIRWDHPARGRLTPAQFLPDGRAQRPDAAPIAVGGGSDDS